MAKTSLAGRDWLKTRRYFLKKIKQRVTSILGAPGSEIKQYTKQYEREVSKPWKLSNKDELLNKVIKSNVVFGADFHAHAQSQRTHLRILRSLPETLKVILFLECLESQDQKIIDLFMRDKISEKEFLRQVQWQQNWGFPWIHYKPLFELAKARGHKIIGLNKHYRYNSRRSLIARDKHAANLLAKTIKATPQTLCYVIYGELHLSEAHLPGQLKKKLKREVSSVTIFQNIEKIYFDLIKKKKDLIVDVVKFSDVSFCIINSPPWVKWQSYLLHLEHSADFEMNCDDEEGDGSHRAIDLFIQQLELLKSEFKLEADTSHITVVGPGDLNVRSLLQSGKVSKHHLAQIESNILNERSFIIPQFHLVYIARFSLNHVSSMAGEWLYISNSKLQRLPWNVPADFNKLIWLEAIGFFCSKILNPGRRLDTLKDITNSALRRQEVEVLKLCLSFKRFEIVHGASSRKWSFRPRHKSSYYVAAKKLGAILGEQMFWGYRNGTIRRRLVLDWFKVSTDSATFDLFYSEVTRVLSELPVVMKSKEERL